MKFFEGKHQILKPILVYSAILIVVALAFDPSIRKALFSHTKTAGAIGGYAAIDGLGQLDISDQPIYTINAQNNSINGRRFSTTTGSGAGVSDTVIDPDGHRLFVSDGGNNRILVFNLSSSNTIENRVADYVIGQPDIRSNTANTSQDGMKDPQGLAFDTTRKLLYVADTHNNRVLVFDVREPGSVATDVCSNGTDTTGIATGMNASCMIGKWQWDNGDEPNQFAPDSDLLYFPLDVALDEAGNRLFVSDAGYGRVVEYDVTTISDGMDAEHVLGQVDLATFDQDPMSASTIAGPYGLAYDSNTDRLFAYDATNSRVMVFDVSGAIVDNEAAINVIGNDDFVDWPGPEDDPWWTAHISRTLYGGKGLAYDTTNDRLFVSDNNAHDSGSTNNRILVFDADPSVLIPNTPAADGPYPINIIGSTSYGVVTGGDPSSAQNRLDTSHGLHYESSTDQLFVADFANDRVMVFDADPTVLIPDETPGVAGPSNGPNAVDSLGFLDQNDLPVYGTYTAEDAPNAQGLRGAEGTTMDEVNHRLYVADTGNNRVLVFNLNSINQLDDYTADYVLGQPDFVTDNSGDGAAQTATPRGVAVNGDGSKLFVADNLNNRVLVFDVTSLSDGMAASNVLGQSDFGMSGSGNGLEQLSGPDDVAYDAIHERLFVADSSNDRVTVFNLAGGITNGMAAEHRVGTNDKWNEINISYMEAQIGITRFATDALNGVMYAGSDKGILRCETVDLCDETSDFSIASVSSSLINGIVYDSDNQRLYSGDMRGIIYTCSTASGCDGPTDWTIAYSADSNPITSLAYDAAAATLYAGTFGTASILQCSSGCEAGNWTSVYSPSGYVNSLTVDTVANVIYATDPIFSIIYRCETSSGCNESSDWLEGWGGSDSGTTLMSSVFDASSQRIYVIDAYGNVMWCNNSTVPCEDTRRDTTQTDVSGWGPYSNGWITLDASRGVLYAAVGNYIYRCDTATDCDDPANGNPNNTTWEQVYDAGQQPTGLYFDATSDALYVGVTGGMYQALVRCNGATGCGENITVQTAAGVAYDSTNDRLFLADEGNNRVLVYDVSDIDDNQNPDNVLGQTDLTGTGFDTTISTLHLDPGGECCVTNLHMGLNDTDQLLYVPDQFNNRIMVFDVNLITNGEDAVDVIGQADFTSGGAALSSTRLDLPQGTIVEQASGRIWTVDKNNNRIMVFEQGYAPPPGAPPHTAADVGGQLDENDNPLFTTSGQDNTPNNRGFDNPKGGIVDTTRHLMFVVDTANNRVLVYNLASDNTMTDRLADYVIGQPDFRTTGASTTVATFSGPQDAVVDELRGLLFVSDYNNHRIMVFDLASISNGMDATAVLGQTRFYRSVQGYTASGLNYPRGLAFDATNDRLFVAEYGNWRVSVFDVSDGITTYEPAIGVLGQPDFTTFDTDIVPTETSLDGPLGVAYAPVSEQLYVSQRESNRISVFDLSDGLTDGEAATHVLGQSGFSATGQWDRVANFPGFGYTWGSGIDTTNNVLYVGTYWNQGTAAGANIYQCALSSGCDEQGDYTLAFEGGPEGPAVDTTFYSFAYDANNGVMYAGGTPNVRRCVVSSGCDDNSEWEVVKNHGNTAGAAQLNIFDGILYERYSTLSSCDIAATDCDESTDWEFANVSADYLAYDSVNKMLYASDSLYYSKILRCDATVPADCTVAENWIEVYSGAYNISQIIYEPSTTSLYAGAGSGFTGVIVRCDVSATGCDAADDWTTILDRGLDITYSFAIDSERGTIYAGMFLGDIISCQLSTDCNQNSDWGLSYNMRGSYVNSMVVDYSNDVIFAMGDAGYATIFRCDAADGCGTIEMYESSDLAVSTSETYLYMADTFYDRVLVYNIAAVVDGEPPVNVIGQQTLTDFGYGTTDDEFFGPSGLWLGNGNDLYVSDSENNRVMKFSISPLSDGIAAEDAVGQLSVTNEPVFTVNGANDSPNALGYKGPQGVALDASGHRLFVSDALNNRVLMYTLNARNQFDDHVADALLGQADFKGGTANRGVAVAATGLNNPQQLAYDSTNERLFVSDYGNNRVLAFDVSSVDDGEAAIMVFGQGSDEEGASSFTTDIADVAVNALTSPIGVSVDETNGALFVADTGNHRVLAYDFDAGNGNFADGDADRVFGQGGSFDTDIGGVGADSLSSPISVYVDAAGDSFWVADGDNYRVLRWALAADSGDLAVSVLGQSTFDSNESGTTESTMNYPVGITKDVNTGDLYVADESNNRILSFTTSDGIDNGEAATAVYGQASFGTSGADTTAETLSGPAAITYDPSRGVLWAADGNNNRVLYFGPLDEVLTPGSSRPGEAIGFYPLRIAINDENLNTDSKNVLVNIYAQYAANFTGTVDVLLSNTPDFATTIPFRYTIPRRSVTTAWNKTVAWDLCFGLPATTPCNPGNKVVYARFYVNVPSVWPALTPLAPANTAR